MKHLSFVLLLIFLIVLRLNTFNLPFERDEGEYAYIAQSMAKGIYPYKDIFDQKPPLIFFVYYLSNLLGEGKLWIPRLFAAISVYLTAIILYFVAKKEFGEKSGYFAMWIFTALLTFPQMTPFTANTEIFMILPLMGAYALYASNEPNDRTQNWFLLGFSSCLAILFKPICIPVILFIFYCTINNFYKNSNKKGLLFSKLAVSLLGFLVILIPIILWMWFREMLEPFYQIVIKYNYHYSNFYKYPPMHFIPYIISKWPLIFVLVLYFAHKNPGKILYYLTLLLFSSVFIFNSPIFHYYLIILPFVALIASYGLYGVTQKMKGKLSFFLPAVTVFSILLPSYNTLIKSKSEFLATTYGTDNPFEESVVMGKMLKLLPEGDVLMYGHEPQILYYSSRNSASKFIYLYPLQIPTPEKEVYEKEYLSSLYNQKPVYIIFSANVLDITHSDYLSSNGFIEEVNTFVKNNYLMVGAVIDETNEWIDAANLTGVEKARLILYRGKFNETPRAYGSVKTHHLIEPERFRLSAHRRSSQSQRPDPVEGHSGYFSPESLGTKYLAAPVWPVATHGPSQVRFGKGGQETI